MFYSTLSSKALPPLHYRHATVTQIPALDVVEISSSSTFNARLICGLIKQLELNWRTRSPPVPKDRFDIPHVCREILESLGDEPNSLDHFGRCSISKVTVVTSIDTVNLYSLVMLGHYTRDGASPPGTFLLAVYVSEEYRGRGLARDALQLAVQYLRARKLPCTVPLQTCINRAVGNKKYRKLLSECGFIVGLGRQTDSVAINLAL